MTRRPTSFFRLTGYSFGKKFREFECFKIVNYEMNVDRKSQRKVTLDFMQATSVQIHQLNTFNAIGANAWAAEFFSPDKPRSMVFQCKDGDRIVGCEGYLDYPLLFRGGLCQTHRSERTLISPTHRGMGIFEDLVLECDYVANKQTSHIVWGATGALKPFARAGFNTFTGFRSYVFVPAQRGVLRRLRKILGSAGIINPFRLYSVWKSRNIDDIKKTVSFFCLLKPRSKEEAILKIADFDEALVFDMLRRASASCYVIYPDKNLFSWLSEKGKNYTRHCYFRDGLCVGYAIFKLCPDTDLLHIVDIFSIDARWIVPMVNELADKYASSGMNAVFLALNGKHPIHATWISEFQRSHSWLIANLGSFVLKTLATAPRKIEMPDLLLTDLWLEL